MPAERRGRQANEVAHNIGATECWLDSTLGVLLSPMTGQPIAQLLPRKPRPQWIVPLVTALVFVAVIMVLYQPA